jgi:transposase
MSPPGTFDGRHATTPWIRKRGNIYLRKLFVHGARATLRWIETKDDARSRWLRARIARRGKNRTAVALANQKARMVWALLARDQAYHTQVTA